ncbi:protein YdhR [Escherichia coli H461]|nr:protein YdhR [Escherichia coli H461]
MKRTTKPVGSTFLLMKKSALAYLEKHTARLKNLGVEEVVAKVFDVNEPLSQINQAKLA